MRWRGFSEMCALMAVGVLLCASGFAAEPLAVGGQVTNEAGQAVAGAQVRVFDTLHRKLAEPAVKIIGEGQTDASGKFSFACTGAPAVELQVEFVASHADYAIACKMGWQVEQRDLTNVDLVLAKPAAVKGKVLGPDGKPVKGALVIPSMTARESNMYGWNESYFQPAKEVLSAETGADGAFVLDKIPAGARVGIGVTCPGYAMAVEGERWSRRGPKALIPAGQSDVVVKLDREGVIEGTVTTPDGKPVADAEVTGRMSSPPEDRGPVSVSRLGAIMAKTDAKGSYALHGLPAGQYVVTVKCTDWAVDLLKGIKVAAGQHVNGQDIHVVKGILIAGKFVRAGSGEPVPGSTIEALRKDGPGVEAEGAADGTFSLRYPPLRLGSGDAELKLYANPPVDVGLDADKRSERTVTLEEGKDVTDLVFEFKPPLMFQGQVLDPDGKPLAGAEVWASYRNQRKAVTGADGTFALSLAGLRPHEYEMVAVEARHPKFPNCRGILVKAFQGEADAKGDVQLAPTGSLKGRVVDADGKPLQDAKVYIDNVYRFERYGRNDNVRRLATDADGRYQAEGLSTQVDQAVRATMNGRGQDQQSEIRLEPAQMCEVPDLTLHVADKTITGMVVNEAGEPVPDADINGSGRLTGGRQCLTDDKGRFEIKDLVDESFQFWVWVQREDKQLNGRGQAQAGDTDVEVVIAERDQGPRNDEEQRRLIGKEAQELDVADWASGAQTTLAGLRGKPVVLAFLDLSKKASLELVPAINKIAADCKDVEVVGIHAPQEKLDVVKKAIQEQKITYRVAVDKANPEKDAPQSGPLTAAKYGRAKSPSVYLIDAEGKIRYQDVAPAALEAAIQALREKK